MNNDSDLIMLMNWYAGQCDGHWEKTNGIKIGTIDNPGWFVKINLDKTSLEERKAQRLIVERTEADWFRYKQINGVFEGCGGPLNLHELLYSFRKWAGFDQSLMNTFEPSTGMYEYAHNDLDWLTHWYNSQCDGDWEHGYSIHIDSLSNPGWSITINIADTELENKSFTASALTRSNDDWLDCTVEGGYFTGHCGPLNLIEVLHIFRQWAESLEIDN